MRGLKKGERLESPQRWEETDRGWKRARRRLVCETWSNSVTLWGQAFEPGSEGWERGLGIRSPWSKTRGKWEDIPVTPSMGTGPLSQLPGRRLGPDVAEAEYEASPLQRGFGPGRVGFSEQGWLCQTWLRPRGAVPLGTLSSFTGQGYKKAGPERAFFPCLGYFGG